MNKARLNTVDWRTGAGCWIGSVYWFRWGTWRLGYFYTGREYCPFVVMLKGAREMFTLSRLSTLASFNAARASIPRRSSMIFRRLLSWLRKGLGPRWSILPSILPPEKHTSGPNVSWVSALSLESHMTLKHQ